MTRAALLSIFLCAPAALAQVSFHILGHLSPDHPNTTPSSISANGQVIIGESGGQPFRWTAETGLTPLPFIDGLRTHYRDLSADGSTIVGEIDFGTILQPFRLTSTGIEYLTRLPGPYMFNGGLGISADGSTIIGEGWGYFDTQAYRWPASKNPELLGDLPGGEFRSGAVAVSSDGKVVVGYSSSANVTSNYEAFRWTEETGMVGLGDLPGGEFNSAAAAVSNDGRIVFGYGQMEGIYETAFRWTAETGMLPLFDHGSDIIYSVVAGISADGQIVVGQFASDDPKAVDGPFVWSEEEGLRPLRTILANAGISIDPDLYLHPTGVSADASRIIGYATVDGTHLYDTFLITLPEPSATLFFAGLLIYLSRRLNFRKSVSRVRITVVPLLGLVHFFVLPAFSVLASPSFTPFGPPPSDFKVSNPVVALSSDGRFAIGRIGNQSTGGIFRWSRDGGYEIVTASYPHPRWMEPLGLSPDGSIVVGYGIADSEFRALQWTPRETLHVLPSRRLAPSSVAYDVALDGTTVGDSGMAVLWKPDGTIVELQGRVATHISPDASTLITLELEGLYYHSFFWTAKTDYIPIGDLPGGDTGSLARGLSDDAQTVVGESYSSNGREAFRWTLATGILPLGDLPSGDFDSWATGVSADGSTIIGIGLTSTGHLPFIWTQPTGMLPLQPYLESLGLTLPGWTLATADAISADGLTIVGQAINPAGLAEPYLLTLPEPSLLPITLFALLLPRNRPHVPIQ
jgi:probable HAF family extracellular repeat protein